MAGLLLSATAPAAFLVAVHRWALGSTDQLPPTESVLDPERWPAEEIEDPASDDDDVAAEESARRGHDDSDLPGPLGRLRLGIAISSREPRLLSGDLPRVSSLALDCLIAIAKPAVRRTLQAAEVARRNGESLHGPLLLASTRLRTLAVISHATGQARSSLNQQLEALRSYTMAGIVSGGMSDEPAIGIDIQAIAGEVLPSPGGGAERLLGDDVFLGWPGASVAEAGRVSIAVDAKLMAAVACTYCDSHCETEARLSEGGLEAGLAAIGRSLVEYSSVLLSVWGRHAALWLAAAVLRGRVQPLELLERLDRAYPHAEETRPDGSIGEATAGSTIRTGELEDNLPSASEAMGRKDIFMVLLAISITCTRIWTPPKVSGDGGAEDMAAGEKLTSLIGGGTDTLPASG